MNEVNNNGLDVLKEKVKEIFSNFKIEGNPIIIEAELKGTNVGFSVNGEQVSFYYEDLKGSITNLDKREKMKEFISKHQMEVLGSIDNDFYYLHGSDSKLSFIVLNKEDTVNKDLFARTIFEVIDLKGIYSYSADQLFDISGKKTLEKAYTKLLDIDYKKISIFQLLHDISLLDYENGENKGNILFCHGDKNEYLETEVKLIDTILLEKSSYKKIRKLLEVVFCKQKVQRVAAKNTKACSSLNFYLFIVAAATFTEESAFCNR